MERERPQDGRGQQGLQPLRSLGILAYQDLSGAAQAHGAAPELDVLILRDPRESVKKCSLTPLRGVPGVRFVDYHPERRLAVSERLLLHPDGELIGNEDGELPLMLIDCSWRRVDSLLRTVEGRLVRRRLPRLVSAYPRRSRTFRDPDEGLASVEALYAALALTGRARPEALAGILAGYRWADSFLAANPELAPG